MGKKYRFFAAIFVALLLLSGCSISEIDELYSLPQPPREYLKLQELIDAEIASGCEYAAPTTGSFRQSVQLADLDKNGTNEALVFLRNKDLQPLICVYRKVSGAYELAAKITGEGSAVGRAEYADIDGDGLSEVLVSWEVNSEMRLLKAYSIRNWTPSALFDESCLDFQTGDINSDGITDVLALSIETSGGHVDMFSFDKQGNMIKKSVKLSPSLKRVDRFRIANIENGIPAIFVEGSYSIDESGFLLTDIVIFSDGELKNIALDTNTGNSLTKRQYEIYSTDIDGNGSLDVPYAEKLENSAAGTAEYYVFDWYTYSAEGSRRLCASTYHCYTDGWYFTLPESWRNNLIVRRISSISGERAVVFSVKGGDGEKPSDLLTIYTLTDENRADRAKIGNRFELFNSETVIYAAEINEDSGLPNDEEGKQSIINRFHLITSEWITGAL